MWTGIGSIINNTKFPNNSSKILDRSNKYNINVISVSYDETLKQERIPHYIQYTNAPITSHKRNTSISYITKFDEAFATIKKIKDK